MAQFLSQNRLGATFAAKTGFLFARNPDTVRMPDFAFVSQQRLDKVGEVDDFWPGAPGMATEVVSVNEYFAAVEERTLRWLVAGGVGV